MAASNDEVALPVFESLLQYCDDVHGKGFYHGKLNDFDFDGASREFRSKQRVFYVFYVSDGNKGGQNPEWDFRAGQLEPHGRHICENSAYLGHWNAFNFRCHGHLKATVLEELTKLLNEHTSAEQRAKDSTLSKIVDAINAASESVQFHGSYRQVKEGEEKTVAYFEITPGFAASPEPEWQFRGGTSNKPDHVCDNALPFKDGFLCGGHIPLRTVEEISALCRSALHQEPQSSSAGSLPEAATEESDTEALLMNDLSIEGLRTLLREESSSTSSKRIIRHSCLGGNVPDLPTRTKEHPLPLYHFDEKVPRTVGF
eukprot:CAMPEP_0177673744 /NCGR_PEP_ID=MMETSP0447-20121125/26134_1 /TAXON_ID=0 /ORGANISM="Stygamoeba regulata, Strain BSH-02190019" /LENGTH=313 /DNA_ID=CAMNT_0019181691 /DNA_START=61 /DNA_END=999 /DNA_ORIENTATION=+